MFRGCFIFETASFCINNCEFYQYNLSKSKIPPNNNSYQSKSNSLYLGSISNFL